MAHEAVLAAVGLAHLDAGDLRDAYHSLVGSSGPVSRYSSRIGCGRASDRCSSSRGTAASRPVAPGRVDDVGLDLQVVADELRRAVSLAWMPPTLAAARNTYSGRSAAKNCLHRLPGAQVELGAGAQQQVRSWPRASRRWIAEPTRPRWPATKILEPGSMRCSVVTRAVRHLEAAAGTCASRCAILRSDSTISSTSASKLVLGSSRASRFALAGSPSSVSTSVGRK
jgi:hypothetical protein